MPLSLLSHFISQSEHYWNYKAIFIAVLIKLLQCYLYMASRHHQGKFLVSGTCISWQILDHPVVSVPNGQSNCATCHWFQTLAGWDFGNSHKSEWWIWQFIITTLDCSRPVIWSASIKLPKSLQKVVKI